MNYYNTKVTVELRELVENGVNIWDFDYPSYYEGEAKAEFERKVIDHYFFRQIGQETVGRFLHHFRSKVREIMPYYIDLYKSCEIFKTREDPFRSYDLTETFSKEGTKKSTSKTESSNTQTVTTEGSATQSEDGSNQRRFSDTPQGSITNLDSYMSEAEKNDTNTSISSSNNSNVTDSIEGTVDGEIDSSDSEEYTLRRFGNIGVKTLGAEMMEIRKAYINVDMMVINELAELFLKVY